MKYNQLEYYLSKERFDRFLLATNHSKSDAQKLYRINLLISQSFYPIINLFEIIIRNSFYTQISLEFNNSNWIIDEKNGFMNDRTLASSKYFLRESIKKSEIIIKRIGKDVSTGKIIAEQSFGFWTSLFEPHHYRLIKGAVIHCFPRKPKHINRNIISQKLNRIRSFRNRIYHNEPICFSETNIDFSQIIELRNELYELLDWIDNDIVKYVKSFDNIENHLNKLKKL